MKKFRAIIPCMLSVLLLGSFACSDSPEFADYTIEGTVTNNSSLPLKDIRVIREATDFLLFSDTIYTDEHGKYSLNFTDYYNAKASFKIKIEDVDLALNGGEFVTQNAKISFSNANWSFSKTANKSSAKSTKTYDVKLQLK
jgi:putative lipoprotein (rSAM/lipoprotein system)